MTKFILHGGYPKHQNELNVSFYKEICRGLPDGGNVLVIHFARPDEEMAERFKGEKNRILEQANGRRITIVLASMGEFINQLKKADTVYIGGGNADKLMKTLKQFPDFGELVKGKVIAGSSAGAYVLSKYYHYASTNKIYEGLGLVPVRVICHYESDQFQTRDNPMELMKKYPNDLELVILRDHEWKTLLIP